MTPFTSQISFHGSPLTFYRWGEGPEVIVALHGFGESGLSFAHWGNALPPGFTLIAPDLPLHGGSGWKEGEIFTVSQLKELIERMVGAIAPQGARTANGRAAVPPGASATAPTGAGITDDSAAAPGALHIILCGYSMGGRLSLQLFQDYPDLVKRLVLVAPDGLKVNFWYWLATQTGVGNRFFRYTMSHPWWFLQGVKYLGKYGLLNKGIVKYTSRYLGEAHNRERLYTIWSCMRSFRPDLDRVKALIRAGKAPVYLIFGRFDKIIQPSQGYRFRRNTAGHCSLLELSTGHQLLFPAFSKVCLQIVTGELV